MIKIGQTKQCIVCLHCINMIRTGNTRYHFSTIQSHQQTAILVKQNFTRDMNIPFAENMKVFDQ